MRMLFAIAAVAMVMVHSAQATTDQCNRFSNCATCVASPFCGWCSTKVTYESGAPGFQCAGFNKNLSNPFICNGVYSTKTCERGYECNQKTLQCAATAAPGSGTSKAICESNCSAVGKTFICNNKTFECEVAPAGQGTSQPVCEASCKKTTAPSSHPPQSHHPASAHPASHHPASNQPHTQQPTTVAPTMYMCDTSSFKCVKAPEGGKGTSQGACEATCKQSNHTPTNLVGLWRTFPISFTTPAHEVDYDFAADGTVRVASRTSTATYTVSTVADQLWLSRQGEVIKCLYKADLPLPETVQELFACGAPNGPAPTSFTKAMSAPKQSVLLAIKCVNAFVNCTFNFGPKNSSLSQLIQGAALRLSSVAKKPAVQAGPSSDPCSNFGSNCTFCLAHPDCGWCSADVVYVDGSKGTRCAGFNPNGGKKAFTCSGSYSTEECVPGWTCDANEQKCMPTKDGSGLPKEACSASCKGKKGPPSELVGKWRGLFIQNDYKFGVVEIDMKSDNITIEMPGGEGSITADIKHVGGEVFLQYTSGDFKGAHVAGIFTIQYAELATYIDLAFGGNNENAPKTYAPAMVPPSMQLVLAKCTAPNCPW